MAYWLAHLNCLHWSAQLCAMAMLQDARAALNQATTDGVGHLKASLNSRDLEHFDIH
jgi:hypothetical protein